MQHGGTCGHCGSDVRAGFNTCTGCGATYRHGTAGSLALLLGLGIMAFGALILGIALLGFVKGGLGGGVSALSGLITIGLIGMVIILGGQFFFRLGVRANRPMWYR